MKKDRKSNIELLGIVSMFMIVFSHVTWEGRFSYPKSNILHNTIIQFPWLFGQIGVIVFTLISAYFLSKKKEINVKSISKLAKITWFWSILALMIAIIMGGNGLLNLKIIINLLFPILRGTYWYVTAYIAMYLLMPYLNIVIDKLNKRNYIIFLTLLLVICSVIPTFTGVTALDSANNSGSVYSLIVIYFIGGFIRKFENDLVYSNKKLIGLFIISIIISTIMLYLLNFLNSRGIIDINSTNKLYGRFAKTNSIFQIISSTLLFLFFKNININYSKVINYIAGSMISVYIIHTNPVVMNILWNKIIRISIYERSRYILFIELVVAAGVFCSSLIFDILRREISDFCKKKVILSKH